MAKDLLVEHAMSAIENGLSKQDLALLLKGYGYTEQEITKAYREAKGLRKKSSVIKRSVIVGMVMLLVIVAGFMIAPSETTITHRAVEDIPKNVSYSSTSEYDGTAARDIISTSPIALTSW